jgi:hypothetical protein
MPMWVGLHGQNISDMKHKTILKVLLPVIGLITFGYTAFAQQVLITAPSSFGPLVKPDMLWNITVVNSGSSAFTGRVQLTISDAKGRGLYSASSIGLLFQPGIKGLNSTEAAPAINNYSSLASDWLQAGSYSVCYRLYPDNKNVNAIAEECIDMVIEPVAPPQLNEPGDKNQVYETHPAFSWIPPAPLQIFHQLKYQLKVVELKPGQSMTDAIDHNTPVYTDDNLVSSFSVLPNSYKALNPNSDYAWQITAYDDNYRIKSEVWQFRVIDDPVTKIIEGSPYIDMKQDHPNFGVMHQGYIKVHLYNYTTDSIARLVITEESNAGNSVLSALDVHIKQGENFILEQMNRRTRLDQDKTYQLIWINSKGEQWSVRYKPKYYR